MRHCRIGLLGAALLAISSGASAQYNAPLAANAYISQGGLDWAWANPLPGATVDLTYQSGFGWRYPTLAELLLAPLATDFLFAGANVPFNGVDPVSGSYFLYTNGDYAGDGACAAAYFSDSNDYVHCDWQDGNGQPFGPWAGTPGAYDLADQLFVRDVQAAVPEPATWAMMLLGFGAIGGAMRSRRRGGQSRKSLTA